VLLIFGAPSQLPSLAGLEHGRTIPLADVGHLTDERVMGRKNPPVPGCQPVESVQPIERCSCCYVGFGSEVPSELKFVSATPNPPAIDDDPGISETL
jgi:hypothetical protein